MDPKDDESWAQLERAHRATAEALRARVPKVGEMAPDVALGGPKGSELRLSRFFSGGPLVLVFQRGSWCPYCTSKLQVLGRSLVPLLESTGARLLVVSPEGSCCRSDVEAKDCAPDGAISIADMEGKIADAFGLLAPFDDALRAAYTAGFGLEFDDDSDALRLPAPASFVIRQDGMLVYAHVDTELVPQLEATGLLEALRAIRDASPN